MQGLKLSELKEGHIYRCLLSGRNVLVHTKTTMFVFNPVKEQYTWESITDYQLSEIEDNN